MANLNWADEAKNNMTATSAPTAADDVSRGYTSDPVSRWYDTTTGRIYSCVDSTRGAAVWNYDNIGNGDMLAAVYDPTGVAADAFDRANHDGTVATNLPIADTLSIETTTADDDYVLFRAKTNGGALTEIGRMRSAAVPTFDLLAGRLTGDLDANFNSVTNGVSENQSSVSLSLATCEYADRNMMWLRLPVDFTTFSIAAPNNPVVVYTLPFRTAIAAVYIEHTVPFGGGTIASYTLSIGIAGNLQKYANNHDVFQAPGGTVFSSGNNLQVQIESYDAGTDIICNAICGGDNLDGAVSGDAELQLLISQIP